MSHAAKHKARLLSRTRRVRGQLEAVEKMLQAEDQGPYEVLQTLPRAGEASTGLWHLYIEGHIRLHVVNTKRKLPARQTEAMEQLVETVGTCLG